GLAAGHRREPAAAAGGVEPALGSLASRAGREVAAQRDAHPIPAGDVSGRAVRGDDPASDRRGDRDLQVDALVATADDRALAALLRDAARGRTARRAPADAALRGPRDPA